jgi:L-glutamine-phosphate cytidylyltransferase
MRVIFLAAGEGSRLGIETKDLPKPLVDINGKSIINRQIELFQNRGISDIIVITGAKKEKFNLKKISYVHDSKYNLHDQIGSLLVTKEKIEEDVIILFADLLFDENILQQILSFNSNFGIAVDLNWTKSYERRTDNPIELAGKVLMKDKKIEKISENIPIKKEGHQVGEFLGIIKLKNPSTHIVQKCINQLENTHRGKFHDAKSFEHSKITDFLQEMIDLNVKIDPIFVNGQWCEIDTPIDLEIAREKFL